MNKKQAAIIVTLMALIVCVSILASKVNGPLEIDSGVFKVTDQKETATVEENTDYFVSAKLERDQNDAQVIAQYKSIIEDKNTSEQGKKDAEAKQLAKTTNIDYESKVELNLKANGFQDVICLITDNKAKVIVKSAEVTDKQRKQIQDVVVNVAKIKDVEIQVKQ